MTDQPDPTDAFMAQVVETNSVDCQPYPYVDAVFDFAIAVLVSPRIYRGDISQLVYSRSVSSTR